MSVFETATQAALILAFALMVLDVLSGIAKGAHAGSMDSKVMREGLWHKAGFVGLILVSIAAEYALALLPMPDGVTVPDMPMVLLACAYIVLTEIVSVFENVCQLNPAIANSPLGRLIAQIDGGSAVEEGTGTEGEGE